MAVASLAANLRKKMETNEENTMSATKSENVNSILNVLRCNGRQDRTSHEKSR
jgi:hypothetical protein